MNKSERVVHIVLCAMAILTLLFFVLVHPQSVEDFSFVNDSYIDWSDDWEVKCGYGKYELIQLPNKIDVEPDVTVTLKKTLPARIKKYNSIMITGNRQDIEVMVGGILRSAFSNKTTRRVGNSSPSVILIVPIYTTDAGKEITIRYTSSTILNGTLNSIYLGSEMSILLYLIKTHVSEIFIAFMMILIGIICLLGDIVLRYAMKKDTILNYLFWFSLLIGIWNITDSSIRQVFIDDLALFSNLGYSCVMLASIPVLMIVNRATSKKYELLMSCLSFLHIINFIAENIIQVVSKYDFFMMTVVTVGLVAVSMIVILIIIITEIVKGHFKNIAAVVAGIIFMLGGALFELYAKYVMHSQVSSLYTLFGMFIFLGVNLIDTIKTIILEERQRQNAINESKAKSQFLATMSHEIRTPINAVLGMNEMILRDAKESVIRDYAGNIAEAGKSLLSLVNDILDFSKIESGKMDIVNVEYHLKYTLRDLILMIEGRISEKGLNLVLDIDDKMPSLYFGDEVRIKQIITNLLTNAAKYTETGNVTFTVKLENIDNDIATLYVSVKDSGIGIKSEDLVKLADSFVRVDEARNRNIEGTGLGLAITRQLLNLMDSQLMIESTYGKGSNFYFRIKQRIVDNTPMGNINEGILERAKATEISFIAPEVRILCVDDNPMNLTVVKGLLRPTRINIDCVDSGQAAIDMCDKNYYDLILMDHMMPGMDGIEALKKIKENLQSPSCGSPVIALTANAVSGALEMYMSNGFDGYLTKPVATDELCQSIIDHVPKELILYDFKDAPEDNNSSEIVSEVSASDGEPLTTQQIDGKVAMQYCGNDYGSYIEILKSYYKYGKNTLQSVSDDKDKLFDTDSLSEYTIKVHSLKSSSLTIGAIELSELAKALEAAGKDNNEEFIKANNRECRALYDSVLAQIEAYLIKCGYLSLDTKGEDENSENEGAASLSKEMRRSIINAKEALDEFDYDTAMEILDNILNNNA